MGEITLNHITKIEGHARLDLEVKDGKLKRCALGSIEGSRYFEGLLKGRYYTDAPEITSRICGICSSAHGVVSVIAMENALGIEPSQQTLTLRELQTIGERIRSHATHLYFLALPDYLGYESGLAMLPKYKKEIERALRIVKVGNDLVTAISGRVMHQVATCIGGYTHFPSREEVKMIHKRLKETYDDVIATAKLFASLKYSPMAKDVPFMSLVREGEYATCYGDLKVGDKVFKEEDYRQLITEYHEPYSNANFVVKDGKGYYVGSLARINNNHQLLSSGAKAFLKKTGVQLPCRNLMMNNLMQAIELIHHYEHAIKILKDFSPVHELPVRPVIKACRGVGAIEAPRGTLFHEYEMDDRGYITYANVVTPTAQALRGMQDAIAIYVQYMLDLKQDEQKITLEVEKLIRSYDPCFSCATHFLEINWKKLD